MAHARLLQSVGVRQRESARRWAGGVYRSGRSAFERSPLYARRSAITRRCPVLQAEVGSHRRRAAGRRHRNSRRPAGAVGGSGRCPQPAASGAKLDEGAGRTGHEPALRGALCIREDGHPPGAWPFAHGDGSVQRHAAAGSSRHHHAQRAPLRAAPCGRADDRPGTASAADPWHGRAAVALRHGGPAQVPVDLAHLFSRMLREYPRLDGGQSQGDCAEHAWALELLGMDGSAAGDGARRGGPASRGALDAGRGSRCRRHVAQRADRESARRRPPRLCPERRAAAARAGLSPAPVPAGLRGQYEREMAAPPQARRPAFRDPGGDVEIHRSHARRNGAPIHLPDGGEVGGHLSVGRPSAAGAGPLRDLGPRLVGTRTHHPGRRLGRRRQDLAGGRATGADPVEMPDAVPAALDMGRRARTGAKPGAR